MALGGIAHLGLAVSDMVQSSAFYDRILDPMGFKVQERSKDGVTWKGDSGLRFTITPFEGAVAPSRVTFLAEARHQVEDIHDLLEEIAGSSLPEPVETSGQDYVFRFEDPDGHRLEYAHTPAIDLPDDTPDVPEMRSPEARIAHTYARALIHQDSATIEALLCEDALYSAQNTQGMILGRKNVMAQLHLDWEENYDGMADFKARLGLMELGGEQDSEAHPCAILSVNGKRKSVIVFSITAEELIKSVTVFTDKKLMKRATAF